MLYLVQYPGGLLKIVAESLQMALNQVLDMYPTLQVEDIQVIS